MRVATLSLITLLAVGCKKKDPLFCPPSDPDCVPVIDAPEGEVDARVDMMIGPDSRLCYGAGDWAFCLAALPNDPINITATTSFDTGTSGMCTAGAWTSAAQPPQPDACFLVGTDITISANFNVEGTRPLVLVSLGTIDITGTLDVAGHRADRGDREGPGAGIGCTAGTLPGTDPDGGGGGAGGSFILDGANGASGNSNAAAGGIAATGLPNNPLTRLRGGCNGQPGGFGNGNQGGGAAGYGGGAVLLVAIDGITLGANAAINASGGGGGRPLRAGGGGGGGSGGMIVIQAPMVTAQGAFIVANGGGGGGGALDGGGDLGEYGGEPDPTTPAVPAAGGMSPGGDGGAGATGTMAAVGGTAGGASAGGGGGGGSRGIIQSNVMIMNVTTSPSILVVP